MSQAGVDVELSNHPFCDYGLERMAQLRAAPTGTNPFVIGTTDAQNYMKVMELMLRGRIADDQNSTATALVTRRGCC
jgi:metallo-beta-lactamase class B